jgi:hypothetical protein
VRDAPDAFLRVFIWRSRMFDLLMLALGISFFALSLGYAMACDRL